MGPGGTLVLNSLVAVHLMFANLYDALMDLANGDLRRFGVDFGILPDDEMGKASDQEVERIAPVLLETINLAALIALAPSFNVSIDENPLLHSRPRRQEIHRQRGHCRPRAHCPGASQGDQCIRRCVGI